jgi:predicted PurR-regulated permease PerM
MQPLDLNQPVFSLTLVGAFVFGVLFACVVRWASQKNWVAQTAWAVMTGVSFTLLFMIPVFGINQVAIMFCYFGASGVPMIFEYLQRVMKAIEKDNESAKGLASEILDDRQTRPR